MTKPSQQQQWEIDYLKHLASENVAIAREKAEKKWLYL
jgi:Uri superfamily endonuclease